MLQPPGFVSIKRTTEKEDLDPLSIFAVDAAATAAAAAAAASAAAAAASKSAAANFASPIRTSSADRLISTPAQSSLYTTSDHPVASFSGNSNSPTLSSQLSPSLQQPLYSPPPPPQSSSSSTNSFQSLIGGAGAGIDLLSEGLASAMAMAGIAPVPIVSESEHWEPSLGDCPVPVPQAVGNNTGMGGGVDDGNVRDSYSNLAGFASADEIEIPLLTGEQKLMSLQDAYAQLVPGRLIPGVLFMTNYRMAFIPSPTHLSALAANNPSVYSWLHVPLACIDKVEKEKKTKETRSSGITMVITCKDARMHRITVQSQAQTSTGDYEIERAISTMCAYAFPNNMTYLFAFSHSLPSEPISLKKVKQYEPIAEFLRLGITDLSGQGDSSPWKITEINKDFRLCSTYPQQLIMPKGMTDEELIMVSNFRSGHRLPTLSWGDKETGATLWRSSQPKAGVSGSCLQDEKFLALLAQSCHLRRNPLGQFKKATGEPILHIVDCRPRASAMANRAAGAGYESQTNYPNTRLEFYNIGNIHVMRDSHKGLVNLLLSQTPSSSYDTNFSRLVEDTQWLTHIRLILKSAWDTATFLRKGQPVLIHCSHGWDRTSQVSALAQIFLDPYYRTFTGFMTLVEKEWNSFGHPFQMRCSHGQDRPKHDDQTAPIFLQFLDCVWQILHQNPHYFEFNSRYLLSIADHIYSCRFGTFLFNSDQDRLNARSSERCVDIWTYLHYNRHSLLNPLYMDPCDEHTTTTHFLLPPLTQLLRNVTLWTDYYFRWSTLPTTITTPEPLAKYINDGPVCRESVSLSDMGNQSGGGGEAMSRIRHPDLDLPAMITCDDFWEAAYRRERSLREEQTQRTVVASPSPAGGASSQLMGKTSSSLVNGLKGGGGGGGGSGSVGRFTIEQLSRLSSEDKDDLINKQHEVIQKLLVFVSENGLGTSSELLNLISAPNLSFPSPPPSPLPSSASSSSSSPYKSNENEDGFEVDGNV